MQLEAHSVCGRANAVNRYQPSTAGQASPSRQPVGRDSRGLQRVSSTAFLLATCVPFGLRLGLVHIISPHVAMLPVSQGTRRESRHSHTPCRRTRTAYASGKASMAISRLSVKSSSLTPTVSAHLITCPTACRHVLRRVLNDGNLQGVKVAQVACLVPSPRNALDLLDVADLKAARLASVALDQQRYQHGPLAVRVDAAAGTAVKGGEKERRASRWLEHEGSAQIGARGVVHHEHVVRLHQLLLDPRRRDEDVCTGVAGRSVAAHPEHSRRTLYGCWCRRPFR